MSKDSLPNIGIVARAEIDGLSIRYAQAGTSDGIPIILTAPWPESIYSFHRLAPRLAEKHQGGGHYFPGYKAWSEGIY